jgi:Protein of unknown function (DUF3047)
MQRWMGISLRFSSRFLAAGLCAFAVACAGLPEQGSTARPASVVASVGQQKVMANVVEGVVEKVAVRSWPKTWEHYALPGKHATDYVFANIDGRDTLAVTAVSSASLFRQKVRIEPEELDHLRFSWKVPELIAQADLALRDSADSPVRIVLAFEGDRSKFSAKNAMLSELAHVVTGEPMPFATLMYVWCNTREPGSVITSARTDRIRKIVIESGAKNLNQWLDYERNIRADYEKAFGEAPGALVGIGIMTDTDNTRSTARAWYGPVNFTSKALGLADAASQR